MSSNKSNWFIENIILLTLYGVLLSCIQCNYAQTTKKLTATLACDQNMTVYIDGKFAGTNKGINKVVSVSLHPGTRVLSVKCLNLHGEAGILGSLDNDLVTDSRWRCTGRRRRHRLRKYWTNVFFDDSHWPQAVEYFPNCGWTIWGKMSDISSKASWIWTADKGKHEEVYCRRRVSDVSVKQGHVQKEIFQATLQEVNRALLLHSRARHEVKNVTQCAQRCREDRGCLSFNVQHNSSSLIRQCELKGVTRSQDPKNYVKRNGYTYYENVGETQQRC